MYNNVAFKSPVETVNVDQVDREQPTLCAAMNGQKCRQHYNAGRTEALVLVIGPDPATVAAIEAVPGVSSADYLAELPNYTG